MEEEPKPPEHVISHYKGVDGQWWEVHYVRYPRPNGGFKDYKLPGPKGEHPCGCGYQGGG